MVRGIESALAPRGYSAVIVNTDGRDDLERFLVESLLQRQVDGLIFATGHSEHASAAAAFERGVKAVMVNRDARGMPFPAVVGDDAAGIRDALDHLAALGPSAGGPPRRPRHLLHRDDPCRRVHRTVRGTRPGGNDRFGVGLLGRRGDAIDGRRPRRIGRSPDRDRRRQRPARARRLPRAACSRSALSGGRLGGRIQRHAVRRRLPAADDDGARARTSISAPRRHGCSSGSWTRSPPA